MKVKQIKQDKKENHENSLNVLSNIFNCIVEHIREHEGKMKNNINLEHENAMKLLVDLEHDFDEDTIIYHNDSLGSLAHEVKQNKYKYSSEMKEKLDAEAEMIEQTVSTLEMRLETKNVAIPTKTLVVDNEVTILKRFSDALVTSIKETTTHEPLSPV